MKTTIKNGAVCTKKGFPVSPFWICDKRLAFSYDESGINRVEYFLSTAKDSNRIVFKRGIFDCFRISIAKKGKRYSPEYQNVHIHPYGMEADWFVEGAFYAVGVYAVDGNMVFTLDGEEDCDFRLTFFENTQLIPAFNGDLESRDYDLNRKWKAWEVNGNALYGGFEETKKEEVQQKLDVEESVLNDALYERVSSVKQELRLGIISPQGAVFSRSKLNVRREITVAHKKRSIIAVVFSADNEDIVEKTQAYVKQVEKSLVAQRERYKALVNRLPIVKTPYKGINDFCKIAPLYHESLKGDIAGAVRAKTTHYWYWGWDSMIANKGTLACWKDTETVKSMLYLYKESAHPEKGIGHWFRFDNSIKQYMALAAQGFYISLFGDYIDYTQDMDTLKEIYPFAKRIFERILSTESKVKGLFIGSSLFPDFPECLHETGRDLSLFNNTVAYNAVRQMEVLASLYGDTQTAQIAKETAKATEENLFPLFYDERQGYFVMSVDADTLEKRDCYSICGYFWDSRYHEDLLGKYADKCMRFVKEYGVGKLAFRSYPLFDSTYDSDANQLHTTWGAVEEVILRLAKYADESKIIEQWIKKVGLWTDNLTCPEGDSYEFETTEVVFDRWNSEPGTWQAYTIRKWYELAIGVVCGITIDIGGIEFSVPHCTYSIGNIWVKDYELFIKTQGEGEHVSAIKLNGKLIQGTQKIPVDNLLKDKKNQITLMLGKKQELALVGAYNISINNYQHLDGKLSFIANSIGGKYLYFNGASKVCVNGKEVQVTPCTALAESCVYMYFEKEKNYLVEVM